jgi:hypothetical protein
MTWDKMGRFLHCTMGNKLRLAADEMRVLAAPPPDGF